MDNDESPWFDIRFGKKARLRLFWKFWHGFSDDRRAKILGRLTAGRVITNVSDGYPNIDPEFDENGS